MPRMTKGRSPDKLCSTTQCYGNAVVFEPKHLCAKCAKAAGLKSTKEEDNADEGTDPGEGA